MHQNVEEVELFNPEKAQRRLNEIDTALRRSRLRQKTYEAKGDVRSASIEESVTDRLLRERFEVTS